MLTVQCLLYWLKTILLVTLLIHIIKNSHKVMVSLTSSSLKCFFVPLLDNRSSLPYLWSIISGFFSIVSSMTFQKPTWDVHKNTMHFGLMENPCLEKLSSHNARKTNAINKVCLLLKIDTSNFQRSWSQIHYKFQTSSLYYLWTPTEFNRLLEL